MTGSPWIASVGRALPRHRVAQREAFEIVRAMWAGKHANAERLSQFHRSVQVETRHTALPAEAYAEPRGFGASNAEYVKTALELGQVALADALARAQLQPQDLDAIFFATVTGIASPSIDARLMNRLPLRTDLKRTPIFGLGCVAGAAGTSRAADYLRGFEGQTCALLCVELCSLTLQREDLSVANVIASGLFGDGAAALVLRGSGVRARGPRVVASRSIFYRDTERIIGWDVVDTGLKIVLSAKVPALIAERLRGDVDGFLQPLGLDRSRIRHWLCHPGGPKILDACEQALELAPDALQLSRDVLRNLGNISSAAVLFVLAETMERRTPRPGDLGLVVSMGPGFCTELVLLEW